MYFENNVSNYWAADQSAQLQRCNFAAFNGNRAEATSLHVKNRVIYFRTSFLLINLSKVRRSLSLFRNLAVYQMWNAIAC